MPMLITPTTELEAVNECLENIGQAPVSSISGDLGVDAQIALSFVRKVNRELQSKGWFWNTEEDYQLTPSFDGDLIIPANTLSVVTTGPDRNERLVQRGRQLYDRIEHTFTFSVPVTVDLVVGLSFEDLPETARRYISLRAARFFQDRIEGSVSQTDAIDENSAMAALEAEQLRIEKNNMLAGCSSVLNRYR